MSEAEPSSNSFSATLTRWRCIASSELNKKSGEIRARSNRHCSATLWLAATSKAVNETACKWAASPSTQSPHRPDLRCFHTLKRAISALKSIIKSYPAPALHADSYSLVQLGKSARRRNAYLGGWNINKNNITLTNIYYFYGARWCRAHWLSSTERQCDLTLDIVFLQPFSSDIPLSDMHFSVIP